MRCCSPGAARPRAIWCSWWPIGCRWLRRSSAGCASSWRSVSGSSRPGRTSSSGSSISRSSSGTTEERRWDAMHHPFTSPGESDDREPGSRIPGRARAKAYDLVLDGQEIGGGSIRIHSRALQQRVFEILGIDAAEARGKFGFLLEALRLRRAADGRHRVRVGPDRGHPRRSRFHPGGHRVSEDAEGDVSLDRAPTPVGPRQLAELASRDAAARLVLAGPDAGQSSGRRGE